MRRGTYRNTGSGWAAGLGILGLLITTGLIIWMFSAQAETMIDSRTGTIKAQDQAKQLINGAINQHNTNVNDAIAQQEKPTPAPTPAPAAQTQPAPAVPAPTAGGGPSGGELIGPISPVTPVAPIQEGSGPNLKSVRGHTDGVNNAMDERNKELEKAMEEK